MVVVPLDLLHGELGLAAELTDQLSGALLPGRPAVIAVVGVVLGQFLESVAGQVEAGVAAIAVQDLVGVVVEAAEAYLTVRLEKLEVGAVFALGRFDQLLVVDQLLQLLGGLVSEAVLKVLEDGAPHELVPDLLYLLFVF